MIQMRMIKYIMVLILFSILNITTAQTNKSFIHGLGIELGIGHNTLSWTAPFNIRTPGGVAGNRNSIYITPNIRANYKINLSSKVFFQSFVGYNCFGGKSGDDDNYSFKVVEYGLLAQCMYWKLLFGIGAKINKILHSRYCYSSYDIDRSDWFVEYSGDAGLRISYLIKNISISTEAWFGINNLSNGPLTGAKVFENHYRLFFGYNL